MGRTCLQGSQPMSYSLRPGCRAGSDRAAGRAGGLLSGGTAQARGALVVSAYSQIEGSA